MCHAGDSVVFFAIAVLQLWKHCPIISANTCCYENVSCFYRSLALLSLLNSSVLVS